MTRTDTFKTVFLLTLGALIACWSTLPLIWDGGYQMSCSLITQEPYYYLSRFHSYFLWAPMVWISRWTDNVTALIFAYGLPFLLAPAVSVAVSAWVVRPHAPGLAMWALFGVAISLPGQVFVINDSIWQHTLFWPILLGTFVPLNWPRRLVLLVLAVFQFPHHLGALLFAAAAGSAWLVARRRRDGEAWGKVAALILLTLLAILKIVLVSLPTFLGGRFYDRYAAEQASVHEALTNFLTGVCGLPLVSLGCLLWVAWKIARSGTPLARGTWAVFAVALGALILWACLPWHWAGAINYRRWVGPLALPFCGLATLDALRWPAEASPDRRRISRLLAGLFAFVLTAQSVTWAWFIREFRTEAAAVPGVIVRKEQISAMKWWQLNHWGMTTAYMVLQGRQPAQYFAFTEKCVPPLTAEPPSILLWEPHPVSPAPGPAGFFDHRPMLERLARENGSSGIYSVPK